MLVQPPVQTLGGVADGHDDAAATAKADLAPLHLLVNWLLAKFGEGDATYVAFRLGGLTVVAARGGTADGLEEFVDDLGGAVQDAPARRADDPRGEGVPA